MRAEIERRAAEHPLAVVELSQGVAALSLQGTACQGVLAQGCGLDFHPRVFTEGSCARTLFAHALVTLDCRDPEEFDLYVGRSCLGHLQSWLSDAVAPLAVHSPRLRVP
jgi:sarcosine oxidase subunit gamma